MRVCVHTPPRPRAGPNGDCELESAILASASLGMVEKGHHVVVVQQIHDDLCVKVRITLL